MHRFGADRPFGVLVGHLQLALLACRGEKTTAQLAAEFGNHASQITAWKKQLLDGAPALFEDGRAKPTLEAANDEELYEQIGWPKMKKAAELS
jgi:transposase-like protein